MRLTVHGFVSTDMGILLKGSSDETPVNPYCHGNSMTTVQATEMSVWFFRHNPRWLRQTSLEVTTVSRRFYCTIMKKKIVVLCLLSHILNIIHRNRQQSVLCVQYYKFQFPSYRFIIVCLQR